MSFTQALSFLAKRFVAGEKAEDAVAAALQVQSRGMGSILDYLGEHVSTAEAAQKAVTEYLHLIDLIQARGAQACVSLKASQMGLAVSAQLCLDNLVTVAQHAARANLRVWMDMEGSELTQKTIEVFEPLRARTPNVGLCLQAALVRTGADLDRLMRQPFYVRLCKGAYKEPASIAYTTRQTLEGSYRMLVQKALEGTSRGVYPAFATHDPQLIQEIIQMAKAKQVDPKRFEFEMLYGIQNRLLEKLAQGGYQGQIYIPYGTDWLPYFLRRLRERKENLYFLLQNLFRR